DLVRLEQVKGTLLGRYGLDMAYDPCRQLKLAEPAPGQPKPATGSPPEEQMLPPPANASASPVETLPGVRAQETAYGYSPSSGPQLVLAPPDANEVQPAVNETLRLPPPD